MKQNKLFGLALAFSLILGSAGCVKADDTKKEDTTVEKEKDTKTSKTSDKKDEKKSSTKEEKDNADKVVKTETTTTTKKEETSKPSSSTSGSSSTKTTTSTNNASTSSSTTSKPSTSSASTTTTKPVSSSSTKTEITPKKEDTKQVETPKATHTHTWVDDIKLVHHDEVGHNEQVLVKDAWDEPIYGMAEYTVCNVCGAELTIDTYGDHDRAHVLAGEGTGWRAAFRSEQVGTTHHDAVYETKYVVDTKAYDEPVVTGQICSECGATK